MAFLQFLNIGVQLLDLFVQCRKPSGQQRGNVLTGIHSRGESFFGWQFLGNAVP